VKLCKFLVDSGASLTTLYDPSVTTIHGEAHAIPLSLRKKPPVFYAARYSRCHETLSYFCSVLPLDDLHTMGPDLFGVVAINTAGNAGALCRALILSRVRYDEIKVRSPPVSFGTDMMSSTRLNRSDRRWTERSSPVLVAYENGNYEVAQVLLSCKCENTKEYNENHYNMGCLYYAAEKHDAKAVKWLLSNGAVVRLDKQRKITLFLFGPYPHFKYCSGTGEDHVRNSYAILSTMSQLVPFMFPHNRGNSVDLGALPVVCPEALVFFVQTLFPYIPRLYALDILFNETYKRLVKNTSLVYQSVLETIVVFSHKDRFNTDDMHYASQIIERAMYIRKEWRAARRSREAASTGAEASTYRAELTCIPWFVWDNIILMLYGVPTAWLTASYWENRSSPIPGCVGWEQHAGIMQRMLTVFSD